MHCQASPGIISKRRGYADNVAFTLFLWTNNQPFVDVAGSTRFQSDTLFVNDRWYHVAVVYDGTQPASARTRVYVNGAPDGAEIAALAAGPLSSGRIDDAPHEEHAARPRVAQEEEERPVRAHHHRRSGRPRGSKAHDGRGRGRGLGPLF